MPVLRSAVNGLAIGILSSTRGVIPYYKNGVNNNYVWGNQLVAINKPVVDEAVKIETLSDDKESIDATRPPKTFVPMSEAVQATKPKRRGRINKRPVVDASEKEVIVTVVNEDPTENEDTLVQGELETILEEKGIV